MPTRAERRWALLFAAAVVVLTAVPYLLGYWRQTDAWRFSGFVFGVEDGNSYIAKMLRGAAGDWLFRSPYSADMQAGLAAFGPYLLLGKLTAPPEQHMQLVALFQGFRIAGVGILILAVYEFAALFLPEVWQRRLATAAAALGGGLGWLAMAGLQVSLWGGRLPLEFYSPETFGFLAVLGLPHLAVGRGLLLLGFVFHLRAVEKGDMRLSLIAGALWLAAGVFQPLTVATGWAVLAVMVGMVVLQAWRQRGQSDLALPARVIRSALGMGLISSPVVIYSLISALTDAYLRAWTAQNVILSPPLADYLLAFLPALPFALVGYRRLARTAPIPALLLAAWVLAFPMLAYAPHNLQRRLPEGIWVALSVLAVAGTTRADGGASRWRLTFFASGFLSALLLLAGAISAVWHPAAPLYHPGAEVSAFAYLTVHAEKDAVVLTSFDISNRLPAWAPMSTLTGHGPESVRAAEIQPRVVAFFQAQTRSSDRIALLEEYRVEYVIFAPGQPWPETWQPALGGLLIPVFQEDGYKIYSVQGKQP